jgi:tryptophan halogenase
VPQFLHADLRVGAEELFREVRPTFKLGIRFDWGTPRSGPGDGGGGFPYPFGPVRTLEATTWPATGDSHLDACSPWAVLMAAGALPVTRAEDGRLAADFGTETAYHLDNRRLAAFLERLARLRGVEVVDARIVSVERRGAPGESEEEDPPEVAALVGEGGRRFVFDLYVDCSGFRSLLVGEALGSPFVDYRASLFTDRAVVGTVARPPNGGRGAPMPPFTRARTLAAGWAWTIPPPGEDHVGSVYSSAFADADGAARELEAVLGARVEGLRELRFRAGRLEHFWRGNAVALGNAYGFVEPLESTSLHLLIRQIGLLVRHLEASDEVKNRLNGEVGAFWDYVRWFLALHFRFNRRLDTPFWRACREEADVSAHGELIERFRQGGPLAYRDDPSGGGFDYPDPLWGPEGVDTLLLGQGVPCRMPEPPGSEAGWRAGSVGC